MKNTILFHSTPEELQEWLRRWIVQFGFHVVGENFFPLKRILISSNPDLEGSADCDFRSYNELVLGLDLERLSTFAANLKSFDYPPGIRVMFPRMTSEGLKSGSLDLIQKEPLNRDIWKALVADVKKHTTAGMWVYIKFNGRKVFDKDLRYTPGIVDLTRQGVQLLPFAGGNPVTIDDPLPQHHDDTTRTSP
jgi:hypothetical protein